jgi:inner membrane protein
MPTGITHAFTAVALGKLANIESSPKFWFLAVVCALLPDVDVFTFRLGIPYGDPFGHRGFSHSLLFAVCIALVVVSVGFRTIPTFSRRWCFVFACFFGIIAAHDALDAMTTGGLGIGFFIPFENTRYFFSFRPIKVSPFSLSRFLEPSGFRVLQSEFVWVWIPGIVAVVITHRFRRRSTIFGRKSGSAG